LKTELDLPVQALVEHRDHRKTKQEVDLKLK
jgi:hypothetical protein